MTALLGSPWLAPVLAVTALAAVTAGAALGGTWDRLTARIRPTGAHRR